MASPLLRLSALLVPLATGLAGACVVPPPPTEDTPPGLEAPVVSPPGDLDARGRLNWWQARVDRLPADDRSEAQLCIGELQLELDQPDAARMAFLDALGGELSRAERARAERGIGLSYFLDGRPGLGERRLRAALPDLDPPAAQEVRWLLTAVASGGSKLDPEAGLVAHARMAPYAEAAGVSVSARNAVAVPDTYYDVSRDDWGARPMRSNHDPMGRPFRITVHHSAIELSGTSLTETRGAMRHIQALHQNDRGWADVGYHFLIDRAGRVVEGRPLTVQGAHAGSSDLNRGNIGICLLGNFASQPGVPLQQVSDAQWETLEALTGRLREDFGIAASDVRAHQYYTGTECPGPSLIAWVKRYRTR